MARDVKDDPLWSHFLAMREALNQSGFAGAQKLVEAYLADVNATSDDYRIRSLLNKAGYYLNKDGQFEAVIFLLKASLAYYKRLDPSAWNIREMMGVWDNLGYAYEMQGRMVLANANQKDRADSFRRASIAKNLPDFDPSKDDQVPPLAYQLFRPRMAVMAGRSEVLLRNGRTAEALQLLEEAFAYTQTFAEHPFTSDELRWYSVEQIVSQIRDGLLRVYLKQERWDRAIEVAQTLPPNEPEDINGRESYHLSKAGLALAKSRRSGFKPELLAEAQQQVALLKKEHHFAGAYWAQLMVVDLLQQGGKMKEALALADEGVSECLEHHLTDMSQRWRLKRAQLKVAAGRERALTPVLPSSTDAAEPEKELREILSYFRSRGWKQDEAEVYEAYAGYLLNERREREGISILSRAEQFYRLFGDTAAADRLQRQFDELHQHAETPKEQNVASEKEEDREKEAAHPSAESHPGGRLMILPPVDLQPIEVLSQARTGEPVRGQFTLSNPGLIAESGTLTVTGPGLSLSWNPAEQIVLGRMDEAQPASSKSVLVAVAGAQQVLIKLIDSHVQPIKAASAKLVWQGRARAESIWEPGQVADRSRVIVSSASLVENNPFYAVPLNQEISARGKVVTLANFRVVTSRPCRVEMIAVATGRLVAIDAEGDGSFVGPGDELYQDADENYFPDFSFSPEKHSAEFTLYLYPQSGSEDFTATVQTLEDDGWHESAVNVVQFEKDQIPPGPIGAP